MNTLYLYKYFLGLKFEREGEGNDWKLKLNLYYWFYPTASISVHRLGVENIVLRLVL